ncbi:MAG TPA: redoxin domain-containing protein [Gemmataceae bacterium]|jgi:peroxiredoxin|nr:redoxin domain-containing protein [Gemmataceae bacterium]
MIELGELEAHHEEFAKRNARVVAVSIEGLEEAKQTQKDFPHLVVVADSDRKLISAAEVLHTGAGQHGEDVAAPTTILIDTRGMVRSLFRPRQVISRLSASDVLTAVDAELQGAN